MRSSVIIKKTGLLMSLLVISMSIPAIAQPTFKDNADKAEYYMDATLQKFSTKGKYAIVFESVALKLKDPKQVFKLAQYQVFKGGYIYVDGEKYEYNLGPTKALCDAKLLVYVDETNKMMMVDSVRTKGISEEQKTKNFADVFEKEHGDFTYDYIGLDTIQGRSCHRIICTMTKNKDVKIQYWIDVKTQNMVMYAESSGEGYDVYVIQKITTPPSGHKYTIYLPKNELTTWNGYEVVDNRFVPMYSKEFQKRSIKEQNK